MTNKNPVSGADTGLLKDPKNMSSPELVAELISIMAAGLEIEARKAVLMASLKKRGEKL